MQISEEAFVRRRVPRTAGELFQLGANENA